MIKLEPSPLKLLAVVAVATVLAYWVGLGGPFVFDDYANFRSIPDWLQGRLGLSTLLFERGGGMFGRPISMASFALNAQLLGYTPFAFKLVNLALHLVIGAVVFALLRRLLQLDAALSPRAAWLAAAITALWLLHPLHASTVLYAVQRMAQWSALIVLLGLWLYLALRQKVAKSGSGYAAAGLFLGIPALTTLAFLAKENGALLPLLCCVVELSYFERSKRPKPVKGFLWVFGVAPLLAGAALVFAKSERFLGAYSGRDFDLYQRLLSQGRALCDYVFQLLLPNSTRMGVFTDDFAISTGWFAPPTTALAFAALAAASVLAWRLGRRSPSILFGWTFFLCAHALEASFLPLELYYEHRNYLPSVGLLTAVVALFVLFASRLEERDVSGNRIAKVALGGALLVFAIGTHGRARVWESPITIATSGLLAHPESINATSYVLSNAVAVNDAEAADRIVATMIASERPRNRSLGYLYRAYIGCTLHGNASPEDLEAFLETTPMPVTIPGTQPFYKLYMLMGAGKCAGLRDDNVGSVLRRLANRADNETNQDGTYLIRYQAAAFFARAQNWTAAREQGKLAWQPGAPSFFVVPLVQGYLATGQIEQAQRVLAEAEKRADASNATEVGLIQQLQQQVALEQNDKPDGPPAP
jgi:protein O-mannosyl-transferase